MEKPFVILNLVSFLFLSGACSTLYIVGENFDDTQVDALVIGETDIDQVLKRFGEPFSRGMIDHSTVFMYSYEEMEFPPGSGAEIFVDKRYKSLAILFDEENRVKHFMYNVPLTGNTFEMMMIHQEKIKQHEENDNTGSDGY